MKLKSLTLFFVTASSFFGQPIDEKTKLDSLFNLALGSRRAIENYVPEALDIQTGYEEIPFNKCGLRLRAEIMRSFNKFDDNQKKLLKKYYYARPSADTSIISPSGFFRIHFNLSGISSPKYNADLTPLENAQLVAIAFDSAYSFEVNYLGYLPPPSDSVNGGDGLYDVYVTNITDYGETVPEDSVGQSLWTSFIKIHYSFQGFYTQGLDAMRVTAAHEFHHAIQLGSYFDPWTRDADLFFFEITATSMEEFVFDDVNDYYAYISAYANKQQRSFTKTPFYGYDLAIWNLFLKERYDFEIIKRQWELLKTHSAIESIDLSLKERGSSFIEEYNLFGAWCYFTSHRSVAGEYFPEASFYPLFKSVNSYSVLPIEFSTSSFPAANNVFFYKTGESAINDTLVIIITSGQLNKADVYTPTADILYTLRVGASNFPDAKLIFADSSQSKPINFFSKLTAENLSEWKEIAIFNNQISNNIKTISEQSRPFPNPYKYSENINEPIYFTIGAQKCQKYNMKVFSLSGLIIADISERQVEQKQTSFGIEYALKWNPRDKSGAKLPTGIYLYVLECNENVLIGKIAIIND